MIKYKVSEQTKNKNYGIYDFLTLESCLANIGVIGEYAYAFAVGSSNDCLDNHDIEGNVVVNLNDDMGIKKVYINYENINKIEPLTLFQYETIIGILNECRRYLFQFQKPLKINISNQLYPKNKSDRLILCPYNPKIAYEFEKEYYSVMDIDSAIEEIEQEISILFPDEKIDEPDKVFKLLPFLKRNNKQ